MREENALTEYSGKLPDIIQIINSGRKFEKIRIYNYPSQHPLLKFFRVCFTFILLVAVFAMIFFLIFTSLENVPDTGNDCFTDTRDRVTDSEPAGETDDREASASPVKYVPKIIDESRSNINLADYFTEEKGTDHLFISDDNVRVLVLHSHSSENVNDTLSVADAGEVVVQLLTSAGISAVHSVVEHDAQGRIGAYNRMKATIEEYKEIYPELVLIIDIHGSDDGNPFQFEIGASTDYAWKENLRIAATVCSNMNREDVTVRILPQSLGQDSGIVTLGVTLGSNDDGDEFGRELIADLSLGIASLFKENTSA